MKEKLGGLIYLDLPMRIPTEDVLLHLGNGVRNFHGFRVKMDSERYLLFRDKGCTCVGCGRVGRFFLLRKNPDLAGRAHLNLWCEDADGTLVMLTKDHIHPKSKGGINHQKNYQPMCILCNKAKADIVQPPPME